MKKVLTLVLCVALLVMAMAGCTKAPAASEATAAPEVTAAPATEAPAAAETPAPAEKKLSVRLYPDPNGQPLL